MAWDPVVLRSHNTTSHYRLLAQLRAELRDNPLVRPKVGERIGEVNRSKSMVRAVENKIASMARSRRSTGSDQRR
ncbi:MAG: hypothetical protein AAFX65_01130 [Cyanobacteria bacterium J06638_7]